MKKLFLAFGVAVALAVGLNFLLLSRVSPEERIHRRLEEMAKEFNLAHSGPCTRGLADDFRDESVGVGKQDIRGILARMSLTERDEKTKKFLYRVEIPREEVTVAIDETDATKAHADLIATFEKYSRGEWKLFWRVSVSADFIDGEEGWQIGRSTHQTLEGRPFR